ncbi:procollagen-proline 4-dioxygenase [Ranunculus cassubicifolius]
MKSKNKFGGGIVVGSNRNNLRKKKLSLPIVLLFCSAFFLAGFYGSMLLSQDIARIRPRSRLLHVDDHDDDQMETQQHESITSGDTGDDLIASIGAINDI